MAVIDEIPTPSLLDLDPVDEPDESALERLASLRGRAVVYEVLRVGDDDPFDALDQLAPLAEHSLTVFWPAAGTEGPPRIFDDHVEIDPENVTVSAEGLTLSWVQGQGRHRRAGHLRFSETRQRAVGSVFFQGAEHLATLVQSKARYLCNLSANAGAYAVENGGTATLKWDVKSDAWKNALWSGTALDWRFWVEETTYMGKPVRIVHVTFDDSQTKADWEPLASKEGSDFTARLEEDNLFIFQVHPWVQVPDDPARKELPEAADRAIGTVFPHQLAFQLSTFADRIEGAVAYKSDGKYTAYAVKGKAANPAIVGVYELGHGGPLIAVHGGRLSCGGERLASSWIEGDELVWQDLPASAAARLGLPASGRLSFSEDGERIVGGLSASGVRLNGAALRACLEDVEEGDVPRGLDPGDWQPASDLDPDILLGMSPFQKDPQGNVVDIIQSRAMDNFYKILCFYMPEHLRTKFISASPIQLEKEVLDIATNGGEKAREFYKSLAAPYLSAVLAGATGDTAARKLNARRAQAKMNERIARSEIYTKHAHLLYRLQWNREFTSFPKFLADQKDNAAQYAPHIQSDAKIWKEQIRRQRDAIPEAKKELRKQYDELLKSIDKLEATAIQGAYWAYYVFRRATSTHFVEMLRLQLTQPGSNKLGPIQSIQRLTNLMALLDASGAFANEYSDFMRAFGILDVLAGSADYKANFKTMEKILEAILKQFLAEHGSSASGDMKVILQEIKEYLDNKNKESNFVALILQAVMQGMLISSSFSSLLSKVLEMSGSLKSFVDQAMKKLNETPGKWGGKLDAARALSSKVFHLVLGGFLVTSIVFTINGKGWENLQPHEWLSFAAIGVSLMVPFLVDIIVGGASFIAVWRNSGLKSAWLWTIGSKTFESVEQFYSHGFAKWLVRSGGSSAAAASAQTTTQLAQLKGGAKLRELSRRGFEGVKRVLGQGLRTVISYAVGIMMSVVGIVVSAIELARAIRDGKSLEIAMQSLYLAGAVLEGLSLLASMGSVFVGAATGLGSVLAIASVVFSALAIVAAVAGLILFIILICKPQATPIEEFAKTEAAPLGLFMPEETSIEYLATLISKSEKKVVRQGLAFRVKGNDNAYLSLADDATVGLGALTRDHRTVLWAEPEENGLCRIYSLASVKGEVTARLLSADANGQTLSGSTDWLTLPAATRQLWVCEVVGDVKKSPEGVVQSATLRLSVTVNSQILYLAQVGGKAGLSTSPFAWTVSIEEAKPEDLQVEPITLTESDKDRHFMPYLGASGNAQVTWSIEPALPDFLDFRKETGAIFQKPGVQPPLMTPKPFRVKVANVLGELVSEPFNIEVKAA